jgi:predicted RNase H-like HicB family nuclease
MNTLVPTMKLQVILEPSEEGGYTTYVPALPGCLSEGETLDEALANIQEAIALYLEPLEDESLLKEGIIVRELVV